MSEEGPALETAPGLARRFASMMYEALLLAAVAFFGTWLFLVANAGASASGWLRVLLQLHLGALFALYFLWCWMRGGQTLAMKAWRIRLTAPGHPTLPVRRALLRLAWATIGVGAFVGAILAAFAHRNPWLAFASFCVTGIDLGWGLVDRDRQFLHDRLAGTRLVLVSPGT